MDSNYYTALEIVESNYVGTVFNSQTNQPLYKSKPYPSQSQAMQDIHTFLLTKNSPQNDPVPRPQVITNTAKHVPGAQQGQRRCCGR